MSRKRVISRCYGAFEWQRFVCGLVEFEGIVVVIGSLLILIVGNALRLMGRVFPRRVVTESWSVFR
jgi:hypothetical protein